MGVNPTALADVERMYKRAYGGPEQRGPFETPPIVDEEELRRGAQPWVVGYHARLLQGGAPLSEAPGRLRRLTVTEAALLQTFPETYRFHGAQNSQYTQIGNAVPPLLAEAVARRVLLALAGVKAPETRKGQQALLLARFACAHMSNR